MNQLHNRYFVMRHGESRANVAGIIIATPENGVLDKYGLTDMGIDQVRTSAEQSALSPDTIIYSSDFSRARQTAEIVAGAIGTAIVTLTPALRERHFGHHELQPNTLYQQVWDSDVNDPTHRQDDVESVRDVVSRVNQLVAEIEHNHHNQTVLLVSHGDTLQIAQTVFENIDGRHHRSLNHLNTAQIRELRAK